METKREVLEQFLRDRRSLMPRKAQRFVELLLRSGPLQTMRFCQPQDRARLRDSVLIATEGVSVWGVLLGNERGSGPADRVRLCLDLLDLTAEEVLDRLREVPIWFLCIDDLYGAPHAENALSWESTALALQPITGLRRVALLDQMDAALEARDWAAATRLRHQLFTP